MNKYLLKNIEWLCFDGAPLILIPENLKEHWLGMYHTQPEAGSIDQSPGFTFKGQDYFVNSELDFENNPITDYDHLCQKIDLTLTYKFPHGEMLALDAFFDYFGWDKEQYWFCNGVISEIDWEILEKLKWLKLCRWTVQNEVMYFINACCNPLEAEINISKGIEYQKIQIQKGTYQVEFVEYTDEYITRIFRLVKTNK